jgi:Tsi6
MHNIELKKNFNVELPAIETINIALSLAQDRRNSAPTFELFTSIVKQLEYIERILNGEEKDKSQMKKIIIGHYAVREFEDSDPEFANALIAAQAIASKIAKGLKV